MNTYSNHTQIAYDLNMHCFAVHELHSNQIRNKRKNDALIHFDGSIQADSMTLMCCSFYRMNHFPKSFPALFLCVGSTPSASLCLLQMKRDTDHYWKLCILCGKQIKTFGEETEWLTMPQDWRWAWIIIGYVHHDISNGQEKIPKT